MELNGFRTLFLRQIFSIVGHLPSSGQDREVSRRSLRYVSKLGDICGSFLFLCATKNSENSNLSPWE